MIKTPAVGLILPKGNIRNSYRMSVSVNTKIIDPARELKADLAALGRL